MYAGSIIRQTKELFTCKLEIPMAGDTGKLQESPRIPLTTVPMAAEVARFRHKADPMQGRGGSKERIPAAGEKEDEKLQYPLVYLTGNDEGRSKERDSRKKQRKRSLKARLVKKATETKGPKLDGSMSDSDSGYNTGAQSDTSTKSNPKAAAKSGPKFDGSKSDSASGYDSGAQSDTGGQSDPGGQSDGSNKSNSNRRRKPGSGNESGANSDTSCNSNNSNSNSSSKAKSHSGGKKNKGKKKGIEQKKEEGPIQHEGKKKGLEKKEEAPIQQMTAAGRKERNIVKRNAPASRL